MVKISRNIAVLLCLAAMTGTANAEQVKPADQIRVPGAPLKNFDIGYAEQGIYALADRSNASIDLFDTRTRHFLGRVSGFAGAMHEGQGGPNGVVIVDGKQVWAGDGGSSVKVADIASRQIVATVPTGGRKHVDELGYDPRDQLVIAANNADQPPFLTLISSLPPYAVKAKIALPRATGGLEQPIWDARTGNFFVAVPELDGQQAKGGVAVIDPLHARLTGMIMVAKCMPAGLATGPDGQLLVGCSDDAVNAGYPAHSLLLDTRSDRVTETFSQVGGSDEVWYDAKSGRYALAAVANPGGPVVGMVDARRKRWIGNVSSGTDAHSIAGDEGAFFVPVAAGDKTCPNGCIRVFER